MSRSGIVVLAMVSFMCGCSAAHAGPCTAQIADVEQYVKRAMAVDAGPYGQQSVGAQLHHQPTPRSVEGAQSSARAGLAGRKRHDSSGCDETRYLEVLEDRLARGTTPAQELLDKFNGPWGGSVEPIYSEQAY